MQKIATHKSTLVRTAISLRRVAALLVLLLCLLAWFFGAPLSSSGQNLVPQTDLAIAKVASGVVVTPAPLATPRGVDCFVYASSDVPLNLPNIGTITSTINITTSYPISSVKIANFTLQHTYVNDLNVKLKSPNGTEITLYNHDGGSSATSNFDAVFSNATFDDDALADIGSSSRPYTDTYVPASGFLADYIQTNANGDWHLIFSDAVPGDDGVLHQWALSICGGPILTPTPTPTAPVTATATAGVIATITPTPIATTETQDKYLYLPLLSR